jgi:small subunit ribosomal protein S9
VAKRLPVGPDKAGFFWGTGRRKSAVARVRIKAGDGKFLVNDREVNKFFTEVRDQGDSVLPLKLTKTVGAVDVFVNVRGGGFAGQAGAVMLGVSRALLNYDPALEPILREHSLLTRDSRKVERKKYGQAGARRRFQFSKR